MAAHLSDYCHVIRINPEANTPIQYSSKSGLCRIDGEELNPLEVCAIYCRYALEQPPYLQETDPVTRFSLAEHRAALNGLLYQIPKSKWFNFPLNEHVAEGKIYPLRVATSYGLKVPTFIVTTAESELALFINENQHCVIKALSDKSIAKQNGSYVEIPDLADFQTIYTSEYDGRDLNSEAAFDDTPTLLQTKVRKSYELRVVVIDSFCFATKTLTKPDSNIDSRLANRTNEHPVDLDESLKLSLTKLTNEGLGLRVCTYDLIADRNAELYLVDVNPQGNWLWQDIKHGLPIANRIALQMLSC